MSETPATLPGRKTTSFPTPAVADAAAAAAVPASRFAAFDDATKEAAFQLWLWEVDRNCAAVARRLAEGAAAFAELHGTAPARTPDPDTVVYWSHAQDWPGRAHELLTSNDAGKVLYWQQFGELLVQRGHLITQLGKLVHREPDESWVATAQVKLLGEINKALGVVGGRPPDPPEMPASVGRRADAPALSAMSAEERAQTRQRLTDQQLERVRRLKQPRKGKL